MALACAVSPRALPAQITFRADTVGAEPLGLSLSGGISMGSYQAGVNFGLLELYRHAAGSQAFRTATAIPRYRLRSVTGASAGNVNTLLWAIEACTDVRGTGPRYRSPPPDSSLFWEVWTAIGWTRIFHEQSPELAVFDRTALIEGLAKPMLAARMRDPRLVQGCSVPAGITLTRVLPDSLRLQQLAIQTQRVVTPFRVTVDPERARGDTLVTFSRIDGLDNGDRRFGVLAHLGPQGSEIALDPLLQAVKASAAFPIAFAPVQLPLWYDGVDTAAATLFLDGGVFDNNPVGLARNLYGALGDPRKLDILYVNPGRYRGNLLQSRGDSVAPPPPGGLASVARFVRGAVPTARQYELQLLARERAHQQREQSLRLEIARLETFAPAAQRSGESGAPTAVRERLLLSSRAYPIFGEHLAAFAAFLARPAREFDFYVGMYDAAHMALWYYTCADSAGDVARQACVGQRLPEIIADTAFIRDPARQVAVMLYNREFPDHALPVPSVADSLRDRLTVLTAVFRAMGTQFTRVDARTACPDPRLISQILCGDGLRTALDTLRKDRAAFAVIDRWAQACDTVRCDAEPVFRNLLANPMGGGTRVLDQLIERLRVVERGMRRDRTIEDDDYVRLTEGLQFVYYASHLRSRVQYDWIPSSAPRGAWLGSVPLSYVGANLGAPGLEVRWQPTWNLRSPSVARASVLYHYDAAARDENNHWLGVGAGFGRYSSRVIVSELGLEGHYLRPARDLGNGHASVTEVEPYAVLLAGQLRLSGRLLVFKSEHGRLHGNRGWTVSAGLSDPTGLAFWVWRILRS
ncbi:MAG TPA: patatin-like phospholipase family protein [Longimicrobium sp.]|nr:patatin-like phospholipase family protein [Longimicrobium sp.]